VFPHSLGVPDHFLFVVNPMQGCVDGFYEATIAVFAPVTLYAEAFAVFAE